MERRPRVQVIVGRSRNAMADGTREESASPFLAIACRGVSLGHSEERTRGCRSAHCVDRAPGDEEGRRRASPSRWMSTALVQTAKEVMKSLATELPTSVGSRGPLTGGLVAGSSPYAAILQIHADVLGRLRSLP